MRITRLNPQSVQAVDFEMVPAFRTVTTVKGAPGIYGHVLDGSIPGEELASLITSMDSLNSLTEVLFSSRGVARGIASLFPPNGRQQVKGTVSTTPKQVTEKCRSVNDTIVSEFLGGIITYALSTAGMIDKSHARLTPIVRDNRMAGRESLISAVISMEVLAVIKETDFRLDIPERATVRTILEDRLYVMMNTLGRMLAKRMITITDTVEQGLLVVRAAIEEDTGVVPMEDRLDPSIAKNSELEKLTADLAVVSAALSIPGYRVTLSNSRTREVLSTLWTAISTAPWLSHESIPEFMSHYGTIRVRNSDGEFNGVIVYANYNHHQESPVGMIFPHGFNSTDTDSDYQIMNDQMMIANGALDNLLPDMPIRDAAYKVAAIIPALLKDETHVNLINLNLNNEELDLFALLTGGTPKIVAAGILDEEQNMGYDLKLVTDVRVEESVMVDRSLVSDFAGVATIYQAAIALAYTPDKEATTAISIKSHNIPADILARSVLTVVDPNIFHNLAGAITFPFKIGDAVIQTKISMLEAIGVRSEMPRPVQMMLNQQYPEIVRGYIHAFRDMELKRVSLLEEAIDNGADESLLKELSMESASLRITIAKELYGMMSSVGSTDRGRIIRESMLQQIKNTSNAEQRKLLRYEIHRRHLNAQLNVQVGMLVMATLRLVSKEDREFILNIINETNIYALVS